MVGNKNKNGVVGNKTKTARAIRAATRPFRETRYRPPRRRAFRSMGPGMGEGTVQRFCFFLQSRYLDPVVHVRGGDAGEHQVDQALVCVPKRQNHQRLDVEPEILGDLRRPPGRNARVEEQQHPPFAVEQPDVAANRGLDLGGRAVPGTKPKSRMQTSAREERYKRPPGLPPAPRGEEGVRPWGLRPSVTPGRMPHSPSIARDTVAVVCLRSRGEVGVERLDCGEWARREHQNGPGRRGAVCLGALEHDLGERGGERPVNVVWGSPVPALPRAACHTAPVDQVLE